MSQMTPWDHLFAAAVFVAYPLLARWSFPAFARKVRTEGEPAKIAGYRNTIGTWIGFAIALAGLWLVQGRSWSELGLGESSAARLTAGLLLGSGLVAAFIWQWRQLRRSAKGASVVFEQLGALATFMPRSVREERWFRAVSINAGITEELAYRGFLLWYLEPVVGIGLAALLSVVAFTAGHAYQGLAQLPGIAMVATALVVLYLLSGSLLVPIIVHAVVDLVQGNALARFLRDQDRVEAASVA